MKLVKFCEIVEICQTVCGECVECCLFTPWESNLFVTHNQYPAKNHHLGQNHRFTLAQPLKKKLSQKFKTLTIRSGAARIVRVLGILGRWQS